MQLAEMVEVGNSEYKLVFVILSQGQVGSAAFSALDNKYKNNFQSLR